jgi:hypothetical protein
MEKKNLRLIVINCVLLIEYKRKIQISAKVFAITYLQNKNMR